METAVIKAYVHAPVERVWDALTDHAKLARFEGVSSARLLRRGTADENGEGAQREVYLGRARFVEDIVRFEPHRVMEYRVVECSLPLKHDIGRITLIPRNGGTEIHWTTRFGLDIPVIGSALTRLARALVCDGFHSMLLQLKDELEERPTT